MVRLEHANVCVHDIDGVVRFLQAAFPEFRVRYDGENENGVRWVHVGNDDTYVALNQAGAEQPPTGIPYSGRPGLNHLAYEADDVGALRDRLLAGGYKESTPTNNHLYRRRVYFYDPKGNDWEFVEYFSSDQLDGVKPAPHIRPERHRCMLFSVDSLRSNNDRIILN